LPVCRSPENYALRCPARSRRKTQQSEREASRRDSKGADAATSRHAGPIAFLAASTWRASCSVSLNLLRTSIAAILFLASLAPCRADPAPVIHYAPGENLEHVDVALIDRAEHEIDMAAYVLTD
jgi:hypothetical protein